MENLLVLDCRSDKIRKMKTSNLDLTYCDGHFLHYFLSILDNPTLNGTFNSLGYIKYVYNVCLSDTDTIFL